MYLCRMGKFTLFPFPIFDLVHVQHIRLFWYRWTAVYLNSFYPVIGRREQLLPEQIITVYNLGTGIHYSVHSFQCECTMLIKRWVLFYSNSQGRCGGLFFPFDSDLSEVFTNSRISSSNFWRHFWPNIWLIFHLIICIFRLFLWYFEDSISSRKTNILYNRSSRFMKILLRLRSSKCSYIRSFLAVSPKMMVLK